MKKVLKTLVALALTFLVVVALVNLLDDDLDPAVEQLLAAQPPQIPADGNGYFAWIGVVGPEDQPPDVWGYRWYQAALLADKNRPGETTALDIDSEKRKDALRAEDFACHKVESCLEAVIQSPDAARDLLEKGRVVLARGDVAVAMPAYQEAWRPDFSFTSHLPAYANLYRQLSATRFAVAVAEGRHDEALAQLSREMAFHLRQMQGAATLIEKMVATANLRSDILLLNQFIRHAPDAARQRAKQLAAMLAPLPADATRMQNVIEAELRGGIRLFLSLDRSNTLSESQDAGMFSDLNKWLGASLKQTLYLSRASANEYFNLYRPLLAADNLTGDAYRQALTATRQHMETETQNTYVLRNPVGHILVAVAATDYGNYFLRRDDLLALRAMVAFQLELLGKNIADADAIDQALPGTGLIHPRTGATPSWNKATRTLSHAALAERNGNKTLDIRL